MDTYEHCLVLVYLDVIGNSLAIAFELQVKLIIIEGEKNNVLLNT